MSTLNEVLGLTLCYFYLHISNQPIIRITQNKYDGENYVSYKKRFECRHSLTRTFLSDCDSSITFVCYPQLCASRSTLKTDVSLATAKANSVLIGQHCHHSVLAATPTVCMQLWVELFGLYTHVSLPTHLHSFCTFPPSLFTLITEEK